MDNAQKPVGALPMSEGAGYVGIGRTKFYQLAAEGEVLTFRIGKRRLVSIAACDALIAKRERAERELLERGRAKRECSNGLKHERQSAA